MKQTEKDSGKKVILGPGTLYGSIKRMLESGLIKEVSGDEPRRKYYTLTEKGRKYLSSELQRYSDAVDLAKQKNLFKGLGLIKFAI